MVSAGNITRGMQLLDEAAIAHVAALANIHPPGDFTAALAGLGASVVFNPAYPDGLSASLVQYRRDQPRRFVEVKLANAGAAALDVLGDAAVQPRPGGHLAQVAGRGAAQVPAGRQPQQRHHDQHRRHGDPG